MNSSPSTAKLPRKRLTLGKVLLIMGGIFLTMLFLWLFLNIGRAARPGVPLFPPNTAANFIIEPLDQNGDVDYYSYVNQQASQGVTPENNAMVKFVQAIGPKPAGAIVPLEYFERLGIAPPPTDGNYLVDFQTWNVERTANVNAADAQVGKSLAPATTYQTELFIQSNPWTARELPEASKFVESNEAQMKLVLEGLDRPEYYAPKVTEAKFARLISTMLPYLQASRVIARHFLTRSNLHWGEGKHRQAITEAMQNLRLGKLQSKGTTLVEILVAINVREIGIEQLARLASDNGTSIEDLQFLKNEIKNIDLNLDVKKSIDIGERCTGLDTIQSIFRNDNGDPNPITGASFQNIAALLRFIDPESTMKELNQNYNNLAEALDDEQSIAEQLAQLTAIDEAFAVESENLLSAGNVFMGIFSRRKRGELLGKTMASMLMPAVSQIYNAVLREKVKLELLKLTLEIEIYKRNMGAYPESLDDLVPKQLQSVPIDPLNQSSFIYNTQTTSYNLFSAGANGTAERTPNDPQEQMIGDDVILVTPPVQTWTEFLQSNR